MRRVVLLIVGFVGVMYFVPSIAGLLIVLLFGGVATYVVLVIINETFFAPKPLPAFPDNIETLFDVHCSRAVADYEFINQQVVFKTNRSSLLGSNALNVQTTTERNEEIARKDTYVSKYMDVRIYNKRFLFIDDQINIPYVVTMTMRVVAYDNPDQYTLTITSEPVTAMYEFREHLTEFNIRETHDGVKCFPPTASRELIEESRLLILNTPVKATPPKKKFVEDIKATTIVIKPSPINTGVPFMINLAA